LNSVISASSKYLWLKRGAINTPTDAEISLSLGVSYAYDELTVRESDLWATLTFACDRALALSPHCHGLTPDVVETDELLAAGCRRFILKNLNLDIIAMARPWNDPMPWTTWLRPGRRTLVLSLLGFVDDHWFDGPLAHVDQTGLLASFLPAGGSGGLLIPIAVASNHKGLPLSATYALDATGDQRTHRCLLAAMRVKFAAQQKEAIFQLSELNKHAAVILVLARQALPSAQLQVVLEEKPTPQWRRLLQNLNITLNKDTPVTAIDLMDAQTLVPLAYTDQLFRSLNTISDVIPRTLT
jgi:hypothetical protein